MSLESVVEVIVLSLEGLGVIIMIIGFIIAAYFSIRVLVHRRGGRTAFHTLRTMVGSAILLGLEVLVAADLIRTVMNPLAKNSRKVLSPRCRRTDHYEAKRTRLRSGRCAPMTSTD